MLVTAEMDRMGSITVTPVNDRIRKRFAKHLHRYYSPHADGTAFFQEGAQEFLADLRPDQRRDLEAGFKVTFRVDAWVFGHWLGWDAHTLAEQGGV